MSPAKQHRQQHSKWLRSLPANNNLVAVPQRKRPQSRKSANLSNAEFIDGQHLLFHLIDLIDGLQPAHLDWITLLHRDWNVDLCTFNLLSDGNRKIFQDKTVKRISDLVLFIPQSHYQPIITAQQVHWVYTCCLQTVGLGRVRIVIDFNSSVGNGIPIIFATNRLDWTSRKVLRKWLERRPTFDFTEFDTYQEVIIESFSSC